MRAISPIVSPCTTGIGSAPTPDLYFMSSTGPSMYDPLGLGRSSTTTARPKSAQASIMRSIEI
jgi:hypothetical protein